MIDETELAIIQYRESVEGHLAKNHLRNEANRRYRSNLRVRCLALLGECCVRCGSTDRLEFAHIKETRLKGRGRGLDRRYRDVLSHPDCYLPLCHSCHLNFSRAGDYHKLTGPLLEAWLNNDYSN